MNKRHLYIHAFSTPDYPFNTIFDNTLHTTIQKYNGSYTIHHEIKEIPNIITNGNTEFLSPEWQGIIHHKTKFVLQTLNVLLNETQPYIYIYTDCDIQFFEKNAEQWNHMIDWFMSQSHMSAFMREEKLEKLNSGFFMIQSEYIVRFIEIMKIVESTLQVRKDLLYGDQSVLQLLQPEIDFTFIPDEFLIYGPLVNFTALFHHSCGFSFIKDKTQIMDMVRQVIESDGTMTIVKID